LNVRVLSFGFRDRDFLVMASYFLYKMVVYHYVIEKLFLKWFHLKVISILFLHRATHIARVYIILFNKKERRSKRYPCGHHYSTTHHLEHSNNNIKIMIEMGGYANQYTRE